MARDREFDEVLRRKISATLDEPIDSSIDADDLMFDLGMRYLRMMAAEKKKKAIKKADILNGDPSTSGPSSSASVLNVAQKALLSSGFDTNSDNNTRFSV